MKGQTWISGEERPFPDPSPMQQDRHHSVLSFSFSYCLISPQFCFLYPEMVDKLILLESLGFLLAPEVRAHVSFPSLFKNTKIYVFFLFLTC